MPPACEPLRLGAPEITGLAFGALALTGWLVYIASAFT